MTFKIISANFSYPASLFRCEKGSTLLTANASELQEWKKLNVDLLSQINYDLDCEIGIWIDTKEGRSAFYLSEISTDDENEIIEWNFLPVSKILHDRGVTLTVFNDDFDDFDSLINEEKNGT